MSESTWRALAVRGRDALFQQGDRIVLARRSDARLIVAVLYCGLPPIIALLAGDSMALFLFAAGVLSAVLFGWVIVTGIAPFGWRYPLLTIDTRARVLLNAKQQLIAPFCGVQVRIDGESEGLTLSHAGDGLLVLHGAGDELGDVVATLRSAGLDVR